MQGPDLADSPAARAIAARHDNWARQLPEMADALWAVLLAFDADSRAALFAHCAGLTVNAVFEPWGRRSARLAHADRLAQAVGLDVAAAGWAPTAANYLGRAPKARILDPVREAKGPAAADLIGHLQKIDMAREAERLMTGTGWLPEVLRTPLDVDAASASEPAPEPKALPEFLAAAAE